MLCYPRGSFAARLLQKPPTSRHRSDGCKVHLVKFRHLHVFHSADLQNLMAPRLLCLGFLLFLLELVQAGVEAPRSAITSYDIREAPKLHVQ